MSSIVICNKAVAPYALSHWNLDNGGLIIRDRPGKTGGNGGGLKAFLQIRGVPRGEQVPRHRGRDAVAGQSNCREVISSLERVGERLSGRGDWWNSQPDA